MFRYTGNKRVVQSAGQSVIDPDWELLMSARNGDQCAWDTLVNRYYRKLVNLSFWIIGSRNAAMDVAQESFYRLANGHEQHRDGNFNAYLKTIAFRLALKEKSRNGKLSNIDDFTFLDSTQTPADEVDSNDCKRMVVEAIQRLDEEAQTILILRFYGELSYEEIAETLQIPMGTVKSRIFRAVKQCRKSFAEKGLLHESPE
jgi:RNA polymerase sigma-70 factor, ECF subfamily